MNEEQAERIASALERIAERLDQLTRPMVFYGMTMRYQGKSITELNGHEFDAMMRGLRQVITLEYSKE